MYNGPVSVKCHGLLISHSQIAISLLRLLQLAKTHSPFLMKSTNSCFLFRTISSSLPQSLKVIEKSLTSQEHIYPVLRFSFSNTQQNQDG
jgi:hypothetical protein